MSDKDEYKFGGKPQLMRAGSSRIDLGSNSIFFRSSVMSSPKSIMDDSSNDSSDEEEEEEEVLLRNHVQRQ